MAYKITITRIDTKTVTKRGEYTVVDARPWTPKELSEEMSSMYRSPEQFIEKNPLKEVRGYAPDYQSTSLEEVEILKQQVEAIDLAAVIKAINGI